jgi:hypothetical protein
VTEGFASRVEEARMVEIGMPRRVDSIRASSRLIGEPAVSARRTRLSPRRHRSGSPGSGGRGWEATPHSSFGRSLGGKYQHRSDNSSSHELQHGSTPFMSEKEPTLSEGNAQRLGAVRREAILNTKRSRQRVQRKPQRRLCGGSCRQRQRRSRPRGRGDERCAAERLDRQMQKQHDPVRRRQGLSRHARRMKSSGRRQHAEHSGRHVQARIVGIDCPIGDLGWLDVVGQGTAQPAIRCRAMGPAIIGRQPRLRRAAIWPLGRFFITAAVTAAGARCQLAAAKFDQRPTSLRAHRLDGSITAKTARSWPPRENGQRQHQPDKGLLHRSGEGMEHGRNILQTAGQAYSRVMMKLEVQTPGPSHITFSQSELRPGARASPTATPAAPRAA